MQRYGWLDIDVHISEFDLNDSGFESFENENGYWNWDLQAQQDIGFVNVLQTCLDSYSCKVFQFCSLTDKWGCAMKEGMPWFKDYVEKPAVEMLRNVLLEAKNNSDAS